MKKKALMLFTLGTITACIFMKNSQVVTAAVVNYNFEKINGLSVKTVTSSSPYDYIDNRYYKNIVKLGMPVIEILEEKYEDGELGGLNAYIAGLAIQEITDCNLYEVKGVDWSNADEFFTEWDNLMEKMPTEFKGIVNSDLSNQKKLQELEKYGVFADSLISIVNAGEDCSINYFGTKIDCDKLKVNTDVQSSKKELREINAYMKSKIN